MIWNSAETLLAAAWHNRRKVMRETALVAGYVILFIVLDHATVTFQEFPGVVAWYPPSGLSFALLLAFGLRFVPAVILTSLISSLFIYRINQPFDLILLWAVGMPSIYGTAAAVLRRHIRFERHTLSLRDVTILILATIAVAAVLAVCFLAGSAFNNSVSGETLFRSLFHWWIGETVGILTVTPFLLLYVMPYLKRFRNGEPSGFSFRTALPRPTITLMTQAVMVAGTLYWVFGAHLVADIQPLYLISLPIILIALNRGVKGVSAGILVVNFGVLISIWLFRFDHARIGELQLLMIVNGITALLLGAVASERKQYEEALRAEQQLMFDVQRRESIGILAGGIAHDFNNLLGIMMGNISLAQELLPPYHPASHNIEMTLVATDRAAHLTNQLLAYAGKGKFQNTAIDLVSLMRDQASLFTISLPKHVRLITQLPSVPVFMNGDPGQIEQVIMNLIINGGEAVAGNQGAVTVTLREAFMKNGDLDDFGRLTQMTLAEGPYAILEVHDTGMGMSRETQAKIFDPFFTTKFTGRGLGLSAVLGIIRGHGGGIAIESTEGVGTTFRVIFPAIMAPLPQGAPSILEPRILPIETTTVLVIDDDDGIRSAAKEILEAGQYSTIVERSPLRGIEQYRVHRSKIGLVLLDLTMPELSGADTIRALRTIDPNVPIIISSGYSEDEVNEKLGSLTISGFIQKPYRLTSLLSIVHNVMRTAGASSPISVMASAPSGELSR